MLEKGVLLTSSAGAGVDAVVTDRSAINALRRPGCDGVGKFAVDERVNDKYLLDPGRGESPLVIDW